PHVLRDLRWGTRIGNSELIDVMQHDGLYCAFDHCTMGESSDHKNRQLGIDRREQDEWAAMSHQRAHEASESGRFSDEITPVEALQAHGDAGVVLDDEGVRADGLAEGLAGIRPACVADGTIPAANAAQISDGAAALVVADRAAEEAAGLSVEAE